MKIIVLGMDNTGKTTLCKNLKYFLNFDIVNSLPIKSTKFEIENYLIDKLTNNDNLIFERFSLFDEMIYGKVLRNKSKFTFNSKLYKIVKQIMPVIIYCRPEDEIILNWKDREQMNGIIENSKKLIVKWDELINKIEKKACFSKLIKYDYTKDNINNIIKEIKE